MQNLSFCSKIQIPKKSIFVLKMLKKLENWILGFRIYQHFSLFCITVHTRARKVDVSGKVRAKQDYISFLIAETDDAE